MSPPEGGWDACSLADAVRRETVSPEAAALLIARDARPGLDVGAHLARIDELAAPLAGLGDAGGPRDHAAGLTAHLHEALGFHGNADAYYEAQNSYLDVVLRRRTGIPITLSVVYAAVGRRAGVQVDGVGFPGHFLARVGGPDGVLIDPFHGGRVVEPPMLERLAERALGGPGRIRPGHLAPVGLRPLVVRMLLNLKHVHESQNDHAMALVVTDRLVDLTDAIGFRRDRGMHALALGANEQARDDLEAYLDHVGADAEDRGVIREALRRARGGGRDTLS